MTQQFHSWEYIFLKRVREEMFIGTLFAMAKVWKQPGCPLTDEWIRKLWRISTMDCYSVIKMNENFLFAAIWMELDGIMLNKISQRNILHDISDM